MFHDPLKLCHRTGNLRNVTSQTIGTFFYLEAARLVQSVGTSQIGLECPWWNIRANRDEPFCSTIYMLTYTSVLLEATSARTVKSDANRLDKCYKSM